MAKTYTFTVTVTLCNEDSFFYNTREKVREELEEWLKMDEDDSDLMGGSPFEKIEIK